MKTTKNHVALPTQTVVSKTTNLQVVLPTQRGDNKTTKLKVAIPTHGNGPSKRKYMFNK